MADDKPTPQEWDVASSRNVRWKTAIPGLGHSSPIIWGDRLFVTTAVGEKKDAYLRVGLYGESPDHEEKFDHEFRLYCLNAETGEVLWSRTAHKGVPQVKRHVKASHANCTPATDGRHVVVSFGSEGLYCYDFEGQLLWKQGLGYLDAGPEGYDDLQWGYASSPCLFDGRVIVQCDTRSQKFLAAFDVNTGRPVWRVERDDDPTFSSPNVHAGPDRTQVIVNGYKHMGGYDADTGRELWRLSGGGDVPVPTPVIADGLIYITNAHGGRSPIYAIKTSASGDVTLPDDADGNEHIAWVKRAGSYMQTPLVYRGLLYACRDNGLLSCLDAKTGDKHYRARLSKKGQGFTASPVAAQGKVYFTSEMGEVHVVQAGPEFELLAVNPMGEVCMATPAIYDGRLYIRSQHHVFCIAE
ncbi:MAG: PQQ-binding-like beta-propeller repeat protein [bacterium]|nr:PQQ-binding-like beta-propeller repeat protein [bacterium]